MGLVHVERDRVNFEMVKMWVELASFLISSLVSIKAFQYRRYRSDRYGYRSDWLTVRF